MGVDSETGNSKALQLNVTGIGGKAQPVQNRNKPAS
jgi:hypothetical protein